MGQFVVPLAMLGIGLIGEWLLGPKGKSTTAAPDAMPMLNSALRGQVIPVTFGANRVAAQVVWTKNFTATRQKSSGKGGAKGGGSGGFGSAKGGGSAGVGYLYYWDMMYNFGMVDMPSIIGKGWIGSDLLDAVTLNAITAGTSSPVVDSSGQNTSAHLSFTESFFAPGYRTDDPALESWAYFEDQMGFACAWPSTVYVGFNQLELGQTPSVPQMSLELVPLTAHIEKNSDLKSVEWPNALTTASNAGLMSAAGYTWSAEMSGNLPNIGMSLYRTDGGGTLFKGRDAVLLVDRAAIFGACDFPDLYSIVPVAGTPYCYLIFMTTFTGGRSSECQAILYKINDAGTDVTAVGGYAGVYGSGGFATQCIGMGFAVGRSSVYDPLFGYRNVGVLYSGSSLNVNSYYSSLPDPVEVETNGYMTADQESITLELGFGADFLGGTTTDNNRSFQCGIAPHGNGAGVRLFFYIDKSRIDYCVANAVGGAAHVNAYIKNTIAPSYPTGCMIRLDGVGGIVDIGINDFFKDANGDSFFPPSDFGIGNAGAVTGDYRDDWSGVYAVGDGSFVIARGYTDAGNMVRAALFSSTGQYLNDIKDTYCALSDLASISLHPTTFVSTWISAAGDVWFKVEFTGVQPGPAYVSFGHYFSFAADVTPPYIIKRILTSDIFGFQASALFGFTITESSIDDATYEAAHQYCLDQGFLFSVTYTNQDNLLTILNELTQLYGGFVTERGGKIYFNTVTATDAPLRTIDNSHLVPAEKGKPPVKITKAALEDGYNKIQFNYLDRKIDYKQNQVEAADEVDIDINGPRVKTYPARYVMAGSVAQTIATRALWANLYGRDQYSFTLGWKDADVRPGALVTLVDSYDTTLQTGVRARITHRQETARGKFQMQATREFPYIIQTSTFFTTQASFDQGYSGLVQAAQAPDFQTAYELPKEFQGSKALLFFGYNQAAAAMGAQLYLSVDSGANFVLSQDQQPFILSGRFASSLEMRPKGYVETNVDFWVLPTPTFDPATPTFIQNYALDDVTQAIRAAGGGVLVVGSEAVAVENLTLLGQNHYRAKRLFRGWGGSPISAHTSGDYYHAFGAGLFAHEITQDDIGTTLKYKIAPYNFAGHTYDISSIAAKSYTVKGLYWLPRQQPRTHLWCDSAASWPSSTEVTGPFLSVTSGGADLKMTWSAAANDEGYGAGGFGASTFGHFLASDSVSYRVDIASKNGVKVSSFVVDTGYFSYTRVQNSTDFAGFGQDLVLTVTPFTVKGDGPVADVRSISLFW